MLVKTNRFMVRRFSQRMIVFSVSSSLVFQQRLFETV